MCFEEPKILTVDAWGGKRVDNRALTTLPARGIVLHHTAGKNRRPYPADEGAERVIAFQVARSIQNLHMTPPRRWRDSAQHFTATRGGLLLEGRNGTLEAARKGLVLAGAHAGVATVNQQWWGIELEGLYEDEEPPTEQIEAVIRLCTWLSLMGRTQARDIEGHRKWRKTLCPGAVLYHMLPQIRERVRQEKLKAM